jgi:regulatory protein
MKILKVVKKDSKNVTVYLDSDQILYFNYEIFIKNRLRKNDEISESEINSLIKENQKFAVKQRAFRYLARRHHSENELRIKLKQKKYDENIIEEIIGNLKESNYLNDLEFAEIFSGENIKNKYWGRNKVKAELIKKGISSKIISQVLSEKFPGGNDLQNAIGLAEKKIKSLSSRNLEKKKLKEKIYTYLFSKGYDYETAKEAVEKLINLNAEDLV